MSVPSSSVPRAAQLMAQARLEEIDRLVEKGEMTPEEVAEEKKGLEERAGPKWRIDLRLLLVILFAAALVTAVLRALPEERGLLWLFTIPALPEQAGEIASVLAPLVAVAVAIERLLETGFDSWEKTLKALSDFVAKVKEPVTWAEKELVKASDAATKAAEAIGVEVDEASLKALDLAEQRLAKAEERVLSWAKAPEYVAWKRAISIWVGLLVGLEVAVLGDLGMLHIIRIPAPRILDMLVTGLVIGAGPGPMHSIIGMLQGGKDTLEKLGDLAEGRAVRDALEELKAEMGD